MQPSDLLDIRPDRLGVLRQEVRIHQVQTGIGRQLLQPRHVIAEVPPGKCLAASVVPQVHPLEHEVVDEVVEPLEKAHARGIAGGCAGNVGRVVRTTGSVAQPDGNRRGAYENERGVELVGEGQEAVGVEHLRDDEVVVVGGADEPLDLRVLQALAAHAFQADVEEA